MMALKDILYRVTINAVVGSTLVDINAIQFDSRNIHDNDLFVAIKGTIVDGHDFIEKAIKKELPKGVPVIFFSSVSNVNIAQLKDLLWKYLTEQSNAG